MRLISAGKTDIGQKRKKNQDSIKLEPENSLFIVADGMGGHAGGELASQLCVEKISQSIREAKSSGLQEMTTEDMVMTAIHHANSAIFAKGRETPSLAGMGTTVVMLYFEGNQVYIGHVGDSRVYMLRDKHIWQLTRDHSLVQEKFKAGIITREQMRTDEAKNVITRSVGFESSVLVDIYRREVFPGESFLLCSDGLSGMVNDEIIMQNFCSNPNQDLQTKTDALIQLANENGGDDNISVLLVSVVE